MTSINTGIPVNSVNAIDLSNVKMFKVSEADPKLYKQMVESQERFLESRHTTRPDVSNHPHTKPYATIEVGGKTVATIYNSGGVSSSNALGAKIHNLLSKSDSNLTGPEGAQERAEKLAEALGGRVVQSSTAITQVEFYANPYPIGEIDYAAMHKDPMYQQLQKTKQARTEFLAQQFAQEGVVESTQKKSDEVEKSSVKKMMLQTSHGDLSINIDHYFKPNHGPVDIDSVPLLLFSDENIDGLSQHAAEKMKGFLKEHNIPSAPEKITYDQEGKMKLPYDYAYAAEFEEAIAGDQSLARELQAISALTSQNVEIQKAMKGEGRSQNYAEIALNFSADGALKITANGASYNGESEKGNSSLFTTQIDGEYREVSSSSDSKASSVKEFLDYMNKSNEERWFESFLSEEGLTKEQYEALPPEEKLKITTKIQDKIREQAEKQVKNA